jgi:predicted aspartyl protease
MRRNACAYFLIFITSLCLCLNSRFAQAQNAPTREHQMLSPCTYIPLKRQAGTGTGEQPVLTCTINGQTAKFLADTGTSFCILSPEITKQLNLTLQPAFLSNGQPFVWKGKQGTATWASRFKVSNVSFTKVSFQVLPDQDFMLAPKAPDDTRYDGIVGTNLLQHFAVLVDASQHQFGLCLPGNLYLKQVADFGLMRPYIVPIAEKEDGRWYVEAQVINDGITASEAMVLDTGSNATLISDTSAQTLHLKITEQHQRTNAYGDRVVGQASVETLRLGDLTLSGTSVSVTPITKDQPSVLGMDILSGYRVLIDFPAKKMYLQPNPLVVSTVTISPAPAPAVPPAK